MVTNTMEQKEVEACLARAERLLADHKH
jgi:hypothetical protein